MTASQQVKEFARRNGLTACGKNGVPMLSKKLGAGEWFIECFDTWGDALQFIKSQIAKVERGGKPAWQ